MAVSASAALSSSAALLSGGADSGVPWAQTLTSSMLTVFGGSGSSGSTFDTTDYSTVLSDAINNYYSGLATLAGQAALTRIQNEAAAKAKANALDVSI